MGGVCVGAIRESGHPELVAGLPVTPADRRRPRVVTCSRRPMAPSAASMWSSLDRCCTSSARSTCGMCHPSRRASSALPMPWSRIPWYSITFTEVSVGSTAQVSPWDGVGMSFRSWMAGGNRLFQRVDSPCEGLRAVCPEGGQLREVRRGRQGGPVVLLQRYRIGKHQSNPKSFLIFATSPRPPNSRSASAGTAPAGPPATPCSASVSTHARSPGTSSPAPRRRPPATVSRPPCRPSTPRRP